MNKRITVIMVIGATVLLVILARLFHLQVVNGGKYRALSDEKLSLWSVDYAPRGEILDRYGRALVKNKKTYFLVFEKTNQTEKTRNNELLRTVSLVPEILEFIKEAPDTKTSETLLKKYEIDESYTKEEQDTLLKIRYKMEKDAFSVSNPFVLLEDASAEIVSRVTENAKSIPNVCVTERFVREYPYPETASHILGRIGKISEEEFNRLKDEGYKFNDYTGKDGAEKAFEKYLKGTDGLKSVSVSLGEKSVSFTEDKPATHGNSVLLTIDIDLQKSAEEALKNASGKNKTICGSAVVLDVNSGEVLALCSYPTYNIETFNEDYSKLLSDPNKPMFNRALSGTYEPGSVYKMITAIAAIDNGAITPNEKIKTLGEYKYLDRTFKCNIFRTQGKTHGRINVSSALGVSCNYFFYEAAKRTGIEKISETAKSFGLGELCGIELKEEKKGTVASKENREEKGGIWYPGDTLQAGIGQSDNLFTPVSLASYVSALANGGTVYKTTLLKAVKSGENGEILSRTSPEAQGFATCSELSLETVKSGMLLATEKGGTAESVFKNFPITVAGKTGSAQVKGGTNGLFVCYAPAENPQIAISVVLEKGDSGTKAAQVARDILLSYYEKSKTDENTEEDKLFDYLP